MKKRKLIYNKSLLYYSIEDSKVCFYDIIKVKKDKIKYSYLKTDYNQFLKFNKKFSFNKSDFYIERPIPVLIFSL